jgi:uncharacterized protein YndB with AHSA1/START domain
MTDCIEKQIDINAPVSRVWKALTNHVEFGEWFRVRLDGPFVAGQESTGHITHPGYEHVRWHAVVEAIEPERLFSFSWHPYAIEKDVDYSDESPTLVEFTLEPIASGTRLRVVESGFDRIPARRRPEALRMNTSGWEAQMTNIQKHVE